MSQDQAASMRLAREYLSRADGLWRRHKARAAMLAFLAAACATGWLVKRLAMSALRLARIRRRGDR